MQGILFYDLYFVNVLLSAFVGCYSVCKSMHDMNNTKKKKSFCYKKVRVKCILVQALRLCTGRTARRESRGIALPFHDHGTRRG